MIYENNELYHHGIKGQKWGVKNGPPYPLDQDNSDNNTKSPKKLTDKQKKAIKVGAITVSLAMLAIGGKYIYSKNNLNLSSTEVGGKDFSNKIISLKNISDVDRTITNPKLYRISTKSTEDYIEQGKRIYVSYCQRDRIKYKDEMGRYLKGKNINNKIYEHVLTTNKPLKVASKRKVVEAYMQATNKSGTDFYQSGYTLFMHQLENDNETNKKFFNILRSEGYNAIVDDNDAGHNRKDPLILLNPKSDIKYNKSHKVGILEDVINTILL